MTYGPQHVSYPLPDDPGGMSTADAYAHGRADAHRPEHTSPTARDAARAWTAAATEHGHASYWGAAHVRAMRAYWLAVWRGTRDRDRAALGMIPRAGRVHPERPGPWRNG